MNNILTENFFIVFVVLVFLTVVLLLEGLYAAWNTHNNPKAKKIGQRLRTLSGSADTSKQSLVLKNRMLSDLPMMERWLGMVPRIHEIDRFLIQSGTDLTVSRLLLLSSLSGVSAYMLLSLAGPLPLIHLGAALGAALLPSIYIQWKRNRRLRQIEKQLPDALDLIARALRAGHALPLGLQMAGEEMKNPVAKEFHTTFDEINFGISIQQALINLSQRIPITDVRYFTVAVLIQREAGGNLTEVLTNLATLIRDRLRFRARVKVLTTEGRMSAWILGLLPFALAGIFNLVRHDFISVLWTDPIGIKISNVVLAIMALGAFWLYRLIQIRV